MQLPVTVNSARSHPVQISSLKSTSGTRVKISGKANDKTDIES